MTINKCKITFILLLFLIFCSFAEGGDIDEFFENEVKVNSIPVSEYKEEDLVTLIQFAIDSKELQKYFHFKNNEPKRSLKMILAGKLPKKLPLIKNDLPVEFPTPRDIYIYKFFDFIEIEEVFISNSKALLYLGYPIEGVIGRIYYEKEKDKWKVINEWIAESSSYSSFRMLEAKKLRLGGDIKSLKKEFQSSNPEIRQGALRTLCEIDESRIDDIILKALNDSDINVRILAVKCLGSKDVAGRLNILIKALQDPEVKVAAIAQKTLGKIGDQKALPALVESLKRNLTLSGYGSGLYNDPIYTFRDLKSAYAVDELLAALKKAQNNEKWKYNIDFILKDLAGEFIKFHQWDNAIKAYEGLTNYNVKDGELWFMLGISHLNKVGAYNSNFGVSHLKNNLFDINKVLKAFSGAIDAEYWDERVYLFRGDFYFDQAKFKEAEKDFLKFKSVNPKYDISWIRIARIYMVSGRLDEAEKICSKAAKQPENKSNLSMNLGHVYLMKGDLKEAKKIYKEVVFVEDIDESKLFFNALIDDLSMFKERGLQKKETQICIDWIIEQWKLKYPQI